jgi:hypothetical protein
MKPMAQDLLRIKKMEAEAEAAWAEECDAYAASRKAQEEAKSAWTRITETKELDKSILMMLEVESEAAWKAEAQAIKAYHSAQCKTRSINQRLKNYKSFFGL